MQSDQFWTSQDGQVLTVQSPKKDEPLRLTLAFWPRDANESVFWQKHFTEFKFSERSTLARIGIEMLTPAAPRIEGNRLILEAEVFIYDKTVPHAEYWAKLFRPGMPVGRLYFAPAAAKLTTDEIWQAIRSNVLKLPNTLSIDRDGRVFLTPHNVRYTLKSNLERETISRLANGLAGRELLDKVQVRHAASPLTIDPQAGVLTSCSMYLKEHYVVLNQGEGNFGVHTSAVLLDPVKTFGTNIMLEIYNPGDQPVVNPMVSVEVFRAPENDGSRKKALTEKRELLTEMTNGAYQRLDELAETTPTKSPESRGCVSPLKASMLLCPMPRSF